MTTTDLSAPTSSVLTFCDGAKPIFWSSKDTDKTIWAVKAHNRIGSEACGWGKKP